MNYDLAVMALEGLAKAPLSVTGNGSEVVIEAPRETFRELARLCLLLGSAASETGEEFLLQQGLHVEKSSAVLRLKLRPE